VDKKDFRKGKKRWKKKLGYFKLHWKIYYKHSPWCYSPHQKDRVLYIFGKWNWGICRSGQQLASSFAQIDTRSSSQRALPFFFKCGKIELHGLKAFVIQFFTNFKKYNKLLELWQLKEPRPWSTIFISIIIQKWLILKKMNLDIFQVVSTSSSYKKSLKYFILYSLIYIFLACGHCGSQTKIVQS